MTYALIEAPSRLGLESAGVEHLPQALLGNGLAQRLNARHAARVEPLPAPGEIDPATQVLNAPAIAQWSPRLADAITDVLATGDFPVILGGDCSILLGSALALKRRGRYGLLFIDGNADFFQVEANPNGEVASMDLALATGHGPALLTDLEGRSPLIRDQDVAVLGYRDHDDQATYGSQPLPEAMKVFDLAAMRRTGVAAAARQAVAFAGRSELDGFFIHLDADVLSDAVMPAVDYRIADGLTPDELVTVLQTAVRSGRAVGLEVTIYNPALDPDGQAGRLLTDVLVQCLA